MKVDFLVHTVSNQSANVPTEVDGEAMNASVPCLEVELVTKLERHGTLTLRFVGGGIAEAKELFKPDAYITADFGSK